MADSDLLITISGPALSLLFYENARSCGDQMGFLLGETLEFVINKYTDLENQVETKKIYNNIEAVVACPLPDSLYNSIGRINKEKLKDLLRDKNKQVIGWFRFRQDVSLVPTFRDKVLHKEFASYFCNDNGSKEQFFVTCLLSSSVSNRRGMHKFKHVFLRHRKGVFEPVPLKISNLGQNPFVQEGSDYKLTPTNKSSDVPDAFAKLIETLNLDLTRTSGVESATIIHKAAEQHLNKLIPELCKSDFEVTELERQIKEFKRKKKIKVNGNSNNVEGTDDLEECPDYNHTECPMFKDRSTPPPAPSQMNTTPKLRNTPVSQIEKNVNQSTLRRVNADMTNSLIPKTPPLNSNEEVTVNVTESTSRNRCFSKMESEIVKESICKGEKNVCGIGRGRGKMISDGQYQGGKKTRTTAGPFATRTSERISRMQMQQRESPEANNVQKTTTSSPPYSHILKKN
ncbi:BRISC complex subunit FAM175B-like [Ceratina calcarata]|uniref:BRISC complex subunit FAM175B-like n=1 Tax=Ceratina calcarata TaxID=156304 RepID=A0AAJ7N566_9HYME|nr:BRISC complex subunit FAM175B-like [Ceratina calcarata]